MDISSSGLFFFVFYIQRDNQTGYVQLLQCASSVLTMFIRDMNVKHSIIYYTILKRVDCRYIYNILKVIVYYLCTLYYNIYEYYHVCLFIIIYSILHDFEDFF